MLRKFLRHPELNGDASAEFKIKTSVNVTKHPAIFFNFNQQPA